MSDDKARKDLYEKLSEAERQVKNGEELLDVEEVFVNLKNKHANDIEVEKSSKKILAKHKKAFEELAKGEDYVQAEDNVLKNMNLDEIYDKAKKHWEDKK